MSSRREFLHRGAVAAIAGMATVVGYRPGRAAAGAVRDAPGAFSVALLGDYGTESAGQRAVADMIDRWDPQAVFTLGDNVYSADGIDPWEVLNRKVVRYFPRFVEERRFFPSLGNHDWGDPGTALLWPDGRGGTTGAWHDVFDLPGNGRYYDVRLGPLHVFVLDDYYREPDGHMAGSVQAEWLRTTAAASDARWKVVAHHFPPYVSPGGGASSIRWPFAEWGITAGFAGHLHHYERRQHGPVTYVVNGLGGAPFGFAGPPDPETRAVYAATHGASRLWVTEEALLAEFVTVDGRIVDEVLIDQAAGGGGAGLPQPPVPASGPLAHRIDPAYRQAIGRRAAIARLYVATFEREPDAAGFAYWTGLDRKSQDIAAWFVESPEFRSRYGTLDDGEFVDRVYANVLGRVPDRAGRQYWVGRLAAGAARSDVLLGFSESEEFRNRTGIPG